MCTQDPPVPTPEEQAQQDALADQNLSPFEIELLHHGIDPDDYYDALDHEVWSKP